MNDDLKKECTKYRRHIFNYFVKMSGYNVELSEDLTQETYLKIYTFFDKYGIKEKQYLPTWCLKVAKNIYIDHLRRKKILLQSELITNDELYFDFEQIKSDFSVETEYDRNDLKRELESVFDTLTPQQKESLEVLKLFAIDGLNYDEISDIKNLSNDSCRQRTTRIRKVLRQKLTETLHF
jgi:RNA polymerase sigma-70 factor (ECF subfamily)